MTYITAKDWAIMQIHMGVSAPWPANPQQGMRIFVREVHIRSLPCYACTARSEQGQHLDEAALLDGAHVRAEARVGGRQAPALALRDLIQGCGPVGVVEPARGHNTATSATYQQTLTGTAAAGMCLAGERWRAEAVPHEPSLSVLPTL